MHLKSLFCCTWKIPDDSKCQICWGKKHSWSRLALDRLHELFKASAPLFPTRSQARSHAHTGSSVELHRLLLSPAQCISSQEQIRSVYSLFIHLTELKPLCQAVLLLCLVTSRFSLKSKTPLIESLFFWFLKNLRLCSFHKWVNR